MPGDLQTAARELAEDPDNTPVWLHVTHVAHNTWHMTRGLTLYLVEKTLSLGQLSSWVAAATEAGCLASSGEGGYWCVED